MNDQGLMTERQRRVMLKLLAISAFLDCRGSQDCTESCMLRLQHETTTALDAQPIPGSWGALNALRLQVSRATAEAFLVILAALHCRHPAHVSAV